MRLKSAVLVLLVMAIPLLGHAQQRPYLGTTGSTGASYGGSGGASSSGMFGARSLGSSLTAGNRGFAGGGAAAAGVQGMSGTGATQRADTTIGAQVQGNERFTRGGRQAGQFVGADTTDLPSFLTEIATGMTGGQRGRQGQQGQRPGQRQGQNANQQGGRTGGARAGQQQVNYRISRSLGFDYVAPTEAVVRTQLGARFQNLPGVRALGPIDVTLQQRTVVLRGSVATAHDRDLAERLALLEAGVDQVQNELTVAPPATPAAPPAPPPPAN